MTALPRCSQVCTENSSGWRLRNLKVLDLSRKTEAKVPAHDRRHNIRRAAGTCRDGIRHRRRVRAQPDPSMRYRVQPRRCPRWVNEPPLCSELSSCGKACFSCRRLPCVCKHVRMPNRARSPRTTHYVCRGTIDANTFVPGCII